jgi:hypothetical protein
MGTWARSRAALAGAVLVLLPAGAPADDKDRPQPPPAGAKELFNGKDLAGWVKRDGRPAAWKAEKGYVEAVPGAGDIRTEEKFGPAFQLHVEFWLPLMADKKDQARANSGVYLQGRYEIQVLDSYKNETYANGSVGALYGIIAPNKEAQKKAVKPPEQWNSYDITFRAPRVDGEGRVKEKGRLTVVLNGVTLINDGTFDKVTGGTVDDRLGEPGPVLLQDHGCPVRFRNLWVKSLKE